VEAVVRAALLALTLVLIACGGIEARGHECASASTSRSCEEGGVYIFTGTDTEGTLTSCTSSCTVGASCTFSTPDDGFVDGVCR
jgi:hypothetical protein